MLGDISRVEHIYLACGYTDMRRGIDGLAQIQGEDSGRSSERDPACFSDGFSF